MAIFASLTAMLETAGFVMRTEDGEEVGSPPGPSSRKEDYKGNKKRREMGTRRGPPLLLEEHLNPKL